MSDLRELPDLARDVSARVVVPAYAEVSRRVRGRRRRRATGTIAAAALVVGGITGGVAVWQNAATTPGPSIPRPADQSPDTTTGQTPLPPTDERLWRSVLDQDSSHPFRTSGTDDGSIAVVWRALVHPEPTFALVIREPDGTVHGRRLAEPVELTAVPGGWLGLREAAVWFISTDGEWQRLSTTGSPRPAEAGDVFVRGYYGIGWLYRPADRSLSPLPTAYHDIYDGYVTPDGTLVTCQGDGQGSVSITVGDEQGPSAPGETCVLAGRGADVSLVGLGDDPDGGIPMTGLVMRVGGTWVLPRLTTMLRGVTSVVVAPGGRTVITDASTGDWYLIGADGHFLPTDRKVGEAFVAGDRLYVTSYGFMNAPIYYSTDTGRTWTETSLPGNASPEE